MDIKDELDAMLNNLKSGGQPKKAPTSTPTKKSEAPPPAVKKSAPRKSVYDSMSLDELLSALSDQKKSPDPHPEQLAEKPETQQENPVDEPLIPHDYGVSEEFPKPDDAFDKPETIESSAEEAPPMPAEKTGKKRRKPFFAKKELPPLENEPEADDDVSVSEDEILDDIAPENEPVSEPLEESLSEPAAEEAEVPAQAKRNIFADIKSVFSRKKSPDDELPVPEPAPEKPENPVSSEEESPKIETETVPYSDDVHREDSTPPEPINGCEPESDIDTAEESSPTEITDEIAQPVDEEKVEENPADELIADIREDAANAIAEISAEMSPELPPADETPEPDNDEESTTENEKSDEPSQSAPEETIPAEETVSIDVELSGQKKKGRLVAALEKILEENPDVISDERSEKVEEDDIDISVEKVSSGKLKRRIYAVFGVIMTLLAVVGLVSSFRFAMSRFRSFTAGEDKKDDFTSVIYPAVIMDIESFSSPAELSSEQIISAALWSLVMSSDDMEKYEKTFDVISVPAIDAEAYAARLFGDGLPELTHTTVGSGEMKFYYNEETKSYNVPVNPITFTYEPDITSISKNGSEYTLTVDYIKEFPAWMKKSDNFSREVSKTVEFKLIEKDSSYVISSMTVINVNSSL